MHYPAMVNYFQCTKVPDKYDLKFSMKTYYQGSNELNQKQRNEYAVSNTNFFHGDVNQTYKSYVPNNYAKLKDKKMYRQASEGTYSSRALEKNEVRCSRRISHHHQNDLSRTLGVSHYLHKDVTYLSASTQNVAFKKQESVQEACNKCSCDDNSSSKPTKICGEYFVPSDCTVVSRRKTRNHSYKENGTVCAEKNIPSTYSQNNIHIPSFNPYTEKVEKRYKVKRVESAAFPQGVPVTSYPQNKIQNSPLVNGECGSRIENKNSNEMVKTMNLNCECKEYRVEKIVNENGKTFNNLQCRSNKKMLPSNSLNAEPSIPTSANGEEGCSNVKENLKGKVAITCGDEIFPLLPEHPKDIYRIKRRIPLAQLGITNKGYESTPNMENIGDDTPFPNFDAWAGSRAVFVMPPSRFMDEPSYSTTF